MTQFRRGDRVRVSINGSYRYYLNGLEGSVTAVLFHGVVVALDNPPGALQKTLGSSVGGASSVGPTIPYPQQHVFQFNEVVRL